MTLPRFTDSLSRSPLPPPVQPSERPLSFYACGIEGGMEADGPAPRSAWGVRPQARHASLLLRPHPLTAERVSSWRRARPDPARSSRRGRFTVHGQGLAAQA